MPNDRAELDRIRAERSALVAALAEAGAQPNGDTLKCPFHPDEHASGRMHKKNGVWRYYCMAGCEWNAGKKSGDVLDVLRKVRGLDYAGVLAVLGIVTDGNGNGHAACATAAPRHAAGADGGSGTENRATSRETASDAKIDPAALAAENAERLQADPAALEKLWRTRAVDAETARRFGVGLSANAKYWTFPVADAGGRVVAVKNHRSDGDTEPKCYWTPRGTDSRRVFPIALEADGPVWVAPGELKSLSIAATGRATVGITGGEAADLPDELLDLLQSRAVALVADDDDAGRKWARQTRERLTTAGLDVRTVNYGADKAAGLKDVGDVLRQWAVDDARDPEAVGAGLDAAYAASDPWRPFTLAGVWADRDTWRPVFHVATGLQCLDNGLAGGLRVGGLHLLVGKSGRAKTTLATQFALNAASAGIPVGVVSLEMSRRDVAHLIAANLADVPRAWLGDGKLHGAPAERLHRVLHESAGLPVVILDDAYWQGGLTRSKLVAVVGDGVKRFGWRMVVLDYLGLLGNEPSDGSDYAADLENSAALKRLARVQNVALVVVAALRKYGRRDDAPTSLDDVLGAGRIVYDAVNVFNVDCQQSDADPGTRPSGLVRLRPLKTRFSGLAAAGDELQFRWYPGVGRVSDLSPAESFDGSWRAGAIQNSGNGD